LVALHDAEAGNCRPSSALCRYGLFTSVFVKVDTLGMLGIE
jgi:hypothetical protein